MDEKLKVKILVNGWDGNERFNAQMFITSRFLKNHFICYINITKEAKKLVKHFEKIKGTFIAL